ncbi:MAG: T9SS type A sorting domain-containing protein [Rhizobacter sp.]|nr:T9SS type A sorting domain-containing protein [Chlorobiales bacterium]
MTTSSTAFSQTRQDAVWARKAASAPVLDGVLSEAGWANADSVKLQFGVNANLPGSGYEETAAGGVRPTNPSVATLKFLTFGDSLYIAAIVQDSSVGSGKFQQHDAFLMALGDHSKAQRPAPEFEVFYGWIAEPYGNCDSATLSQVGAAPCYAGGSRDSIDQATGLPNRFTWDAAVSVNGTVNDDATPDAGYVMEFKINLKARGYDASKVGGEIVEFHGTFYDTDWKWPNDPSKAHTTKAWWQSPWGNTTWYNMGRVHINPSVTTTSGTAPAIPVDVRIPNGQAFATPVVDGVLTDAAWNASSNTSKFDIRYGDDGLRESYAGIGPYRSGQFQPQIAGVTATVADPADATISWFFKADTLFIAADVRDQSVWGIDNLDQWDGVRFTVCDRQKRNADSTLQAFEFTVRVDSTTGGAKLEGDSAKLAQGVIRAGLTLKPNTVFNTLDGADEGYNIEIAIDLTKLGYAAGRGDGAFFVGATVYDGEKFTDPTTNYGNRAWWFRERGGNGAAAAWAYLDPSLTLSTPSQGGTGSQPKQFVLLGNYPNPFNPTTNIRFALPQSSSMTLEVFNTLGQRVGVRTLGDFAAGTHQVKFDAARLSSGTYFYKLNASSKVNGSVSLTGKMTILK